MKKKLKNYLIVSLMLFTLILRGDSCGSGSGLVSDPNFDVWCSDTLCAWQVDEGTIEQAPTWHAEDYGVELVGAPVQISQVLDIESTGGQCFKFNLMSDVDTSSAVWVEFAGDVVEEEERRGAALCGVDADGGEFEGENEGACFAL